MAAALAVQGAAADLRNVVSAAAETRPRRRSETCSSVAEAEAILRQSAEQNERIATVRQNAAQAIQQAKAAANNLELGISDLDTTMERASSFDEKWEAFKAKFDDLNKMAAERLKEVMCGGMPGSGVRPAEFVSVGRVAQVLRRASRVVVLTGAGVSSESGVPTFRGADGYWTVGSVNYKPQEMATWEKFNEMPEELWKWYQYRWRMCRKALPNPGHYALVELEGLLEGGYDLVTQNVDGLHLDAGSNRERLYEIHGRIDEMRCDDRLEGACLYGVNVDDPENMDRARATIVKTPAPAKDECDEKVHHCSKCGKRQRPKVLWFDENYNEAFYRFRTVLDATKACDVLLIIGTQLTTGCPSRMVSLARSSNATIINVDPNTDIKDERFAGMLHLRAKSGEVLPQINAELRKLREEPLLAPLAAVPCVGTPPAAKAIAHVMPKSAPRASPKAAAKALMQRSSLVESSALNSVASPSAARRSSSQPSAGRRPSSSSRSGAATFKAAANISLAKGSAPRARSPVASRLAAKAKSPILPDVLPANRLASQMNSSSRVLHSEVASSAACGFFVYGTLRPDDDSGASWTKGFCEGMQSEAATLPGASLYVEGYPAVNFEETRCSVRGVLLRPKGFDVAEVMAAKLAEADRIEGYPDLYERAIVTVNTERGEALPAYVYHRTGRTDRKSSVRIPDGDWLSRKR